MDISELIANSIRQSAVEVFTTMLSAEVKADEVRMESAVAEPNNGVVSFIGLAGSWAGTGSIVCSPAVACRVCTQMLMTEATVVNEDVLDAVAELTNMIIGGVKTELEKQLGPLGLSIPTVVFGRNFKTKGAGNAQWCIERFHWDQEEFVVKVCLEPNKQHSHTSPQATGQTCPIEVKPLV